jgi:hypothetical protein
MRRAARSNGLGLRSRQPNVVRKGKSSHLVVMRVVVLMEGAEDDMFKTCKHKRGGVKVDLKGREVS